MHELYEPTAEAIATVEGYARVARRAMPGLSRQFLHSTRLRIRQPSDREPHEFSSPLPADLAAVLRDIKTGRG